MKGFRSEQVMPRCVECGAETPRDKMRGAPDELRCEPCASKAYAPFVQPRRRAGAPSQPIVTGIAIVAAMTCTALYHSSRENVQFLVANAPAVWDGQVWRLVTSVFPHADIVHLAFNVYWLWQFGRVVEGWMGSVRFAGFFILMAFGSSAAQLLVSGDGGIGL